MSGIEPMVWREYDPQTGVGDPSTPVTAARLNQWTADLVAVSDAAEGYAAEAQQAAQDAADTTDGILTGVIEDPDSDSRAALDQRYATLAALALRAPMPLSGTYAARPAATTVLPGTAYTATDLFETYTSDGSAWTLTGASRSELGYAEIVAEHVGTTVAGADVPGLSVTFKATTRVMYAEFSGTMRVGSGTSLVRARILLDGTLVGVAGTTEAQNVAVHRGVRLSGLAAGSTYTVKIAVDLPGGTQGTSSGAINAGPTNPASVRVFAR